MPTILEFGIAIGDLPNFRSFAMHSQTSPDKVKVLVDAMNKALATPEWKRYCAQTYSCTAANTPAQAKARVQAMVDKVSSYRERLAR